jgi:hypothetical protein
MLGGDLTVLVWRRHQGSEIGVITKLSSTVDDAIERWMNQVEDLTVGAGMPVFRFIWDALKASDGSA